MGHEITEIDRVGLKGEQAWHKMGVVVQDDLTAEQAGERFGMFWGVDGRQLAFKASNGEWVPFDSHVANVRTGDCDGNAIEHLLGVVGQGYEVCQNRELAQFTDALAQTGKVTIESCGTIRGGKRLWFLAKGDAFNIGGGDKIFPYLCISNGHDGTQSIRVTPTTVRVVCSNTLHMVIPADDAQQRPDTAAITIRHSGQIMDKLEQAKRAVSYYQQTVYRNIELYDAMQAKRMDRDQALKLFATAYAAFWETATEADLNSADSEVKKVAESRMRRMKQGADAFLSRYESENAELGLGETQWSYFNALTGYIQHDKRTRGGSDWERVERRIESNLFGLNASRTHEALAATLATN